VGDPSVSEADLQVAKEFLETLAAAAKTGEREALYPFLAPDVAWLTPQTDLHGIDEVRDRLTWLTPKHRLEIEFEEIGLTDLGEGRVASDVHEIYSMREDGEFAYARDRRIELTIREGKIARYEMRIVG
jgi:ketosteroid isomerase-like protein